MGKTHVFGFATASRVFDLPVEVSFECIADATDALAENARHAFGFSRSTGNWRDLLDDSAIHVVDITAPNEFHKDMALAAVAKGKHVYCEKPLAPTATDALEMTEAAEAAGVCTQVGFNYLANPMIRVAQQMIQSGELGEIRSYRGVHAEDYMANATDPWTWRHDPIGGGALADLGSHALATAEFLLGPITDVLGHCANLIDTRPDAAGKPKPVEVDDIGRAFLNFASGATGSIEANWIAMGRKMQHDFEVYGSRGALSFTQDRFNELQYYNSDDARGRQGFRTIVAGPDHEPYGLFCVAPGHQLGFNDLKSIEIEGYIRAIAGEQLNRTTFRTGWRIQHLVETIQQSALSGRWMNTGPLP